MKKKTKKPRRKIAKIELQLTPRMLSFLKDEAAFYKVKSKKHPNVHIILRYRDCDDSNLN
jgi:hypothetical protein